MPSKATSGSSWTEGWSCIVSMTSKMVSPLRPPSYPPRKRVIESRPNLSSLSMAFGLLVSRLYYRRDNQQESTPLGYCGGPAPWGAIIKWLFLYDFDDFFGPIGS